MTNNFDLKKFLKENKLTKNAKLISENEDSNLGKKIDYKTIELGGVDPEDYHDFSDAYIAYAEYEDGTPLPDEELDKLGDLAQEMAAESLYENLEEGTEDNMESELDLGHQFTFDKDEENSGSIYKEHGIYCVKGFENGNHFDESFDNFEDAKDFYLGKKEGETMNEAINYDNLSKSSIEDLKALMDVKKKEREKIRANKNPLPFLKGQDKELGDQMGKIERELNSRLKETENMNENKLTAREKRLVEMVQDALNPIGRTENPIQMQSPKGVEEEAVSEEALEEAPAIPKYNSIEELMKEIEEGTNKAGHEYKMNKMKEVCEALETKVTSLEEGENAEHIDQKKVKQMRKDIAALRKAEEKLRKDFDKRFTGKEKKETPKVEKEEPVLAEGFDLRKYLIENRKK